MKFKGSGVVLAKLIDIMFEGPQKFKKMGIQINVMCYRSDFDCNEYAFCHTTFIDKNKDILKTNKKYSSRESLCYDISILKKDHYMYKQRLIKLVIIN